MDRKIGSAIMLTGIMIAVSHPVNANAAESASPNRRANTDGLRDSVSDNKSDISTLVDYLQKHGDEWLIKEHLAPVLGLPGPMPSRMATFSNEDHSTSHGFDHLARVCILVYENTPASKQPRCIYLEKHLVTGYDDETRYYRISLEGKLEKAIVSRGKRDAMGKPVIGSGVASDQDINSIETRKAFAAEMAAMRKWLKAQKAIPSPASSSGGSQGTAAAAAAAP